MTLKERIVNNLCCFCEAPLDGDGRNPDPACTVDEAECCAGCEGLIVFPARQAVHTIVSNGMKLIEELEQDV